MTPRAGLALAFAAALLLDGCGGAAPPTPPPAAAVPPRPLAPKEPDAGPPLPATTYEAKGRRDPFVPVVAAEGGKSGLTVASVKLTGIIAGRQGPLGLIEAPDGIGYIVKSGDVLGDGRVLEVGKDSISFAVAGRPGQPSTTVTLRLRTD